MPFTCGHYKTQQSGSHVYCMICGEAVKTEPTYECYEHRVAESNLLEANERIRELTAKLNAATWVLAQIVNDLPIKRDWLDPDLEREAKCVLGKGTRQ